MTVTNPRIPVLTAECERSAIIFAHDLPPQGSGDPQLDAITDFAAALCDAPIAIVSVIDGDRQGFLGRTGVGDVTEAPRATSFCGHAMMKADIMVVPDATKDARFAENPLVTGPPGIRFYAGVSLVSEEGAPLGALCVIDQVARHGLTELQRQGLQMLGHHAQLWLDQRRGLRAGHLADMRARAELLQSEGRFRVLADAMPQMVWSTRPDGFHDYYNARWYEFTGTPNGSTDGEGWNDMFHPEDQARAWAAWTQSLATGDPYQIEYRLRRKDGEYRWTLGRALPIRDEAGAITRWFGTCTDIHEHKLVEEEREVISQELSHRIKNIFSVIAGLIGFSARANPQFAGTAKDLRERVLALGRAHDFVRPHSAKSRPTSSPNSLIGLLEQLFAPYQGAGGMRVTIDGADAAIDDRSATPFALLFHELATNAAKYGALSQEAGRISLSISDRGDGVEMVWKETGGPRVATPPDVLGFGSQLLELSAVRQLGGTVDRAWDEDGLRVTIVTPHGALSRQAKSG